MTKKLKKLKRNRYRHLSSSPRSTSISRCFHGIRGGGSGRFEPSYAQSRWLTRSFLAASVPCNADKPPASSCSSFFLFFSFFFVRKSADPLYAAGYISRRRATAFPFMPRGRSVSRAHEIRGRRAVAGIRAFRAWNFAWKGPEFKRGNRIARARRSALQPGFRTLGVRRVCSAASFSLFFSLIF